MFKRLEDGSISLSYEDYNVEAFGGADYEVIYTITMEESNKLYNKLDKEYRSKGGKNNLYLQELIYDKFGERLEKMSFAKFCAENGIKYKLNTFVH
jgi:hypothetical protein